eukprot:TRINITY_DN8196_c0_g1_i1.p1 TRINITY_DN8196_c0_g1~~TRINITY_DN8196_c0_g1_i1.p1  ORF type:complete len:485 (+),score=59.96 TRINITY_DN8196_c0_g1_i1:60-1457(+)
MASVLEGQAAGDPTTANDPGDCESSNPRAETLVLTPPPDPRMQHVATLPSTPVRISQYALSSSGSSTVVHAVCGRFRTSAPSTPTPSGIESLRGWISPSPFIREGNPSPSLTSDDDDSLLAAAMISPELAHLKSDTDGLRAKLAAFEGRIDRLERSAVSESAGPPSEPWQELLLLNRRMQQQLEETEARAIRAENTCAELQVAVQHLRFQMAKLSEYVADRPRATEAQTFAVAPTVNLTAVPPTGPLAIPQAQLPATASMTHIVSPTGAVFAPYGGTVQPVVSRTMVAPQRPPAKQSGRPTGFTHLQHAPGQSAAFPTSATDVGAISTVDLLQSQEGAPEIVIAGCKGPVEEWLPVLQHVIQSKAVECLHLYGGLPPEAAASIGTEIQQTHNVTCLALNNIGTAAVVALAQQLAKGTQTMLKVCVQRGVNAIAESALERLCQSNRHVEVIYCDLHVPSVGKSKRQ